MGLSCGAILLCDLSPRAARALFSHADARVPFRVDSQCSLFLSFGALPRAPSKGHGPFANPYCFGFRGGYLKLSLALHADACLPIGIRSPGVCENEELFVACYSTARLWCRAALESNLKTLSLWANIAERVH